MRSSAGNLRACSCVNSNIAYVFVSAWVAAYASGEWECEDGSSDADVDADADASDGIGADGDGDEVWVIVGG